MEPASIRSKNPGAIWGKGANGQLNALAKKWGATGYEMLADGKGQGNNIAKFPSFVAGICAQMDLWRTSPNYRNKRFADAIATWSGHNEVPSYIRFVMQRCPGIGPDTVMDDAFWRGSMAIPFLKAQAWHEAGQPYPAAESDWIEARRRVLAGATPPVGHPAAKPATTATVATGTVIAVDQTARKPAAQGGGIDWMLAIPILVVGFSVAAVVWFVWPRRTEQNQTVSAQPTPPGSQP